MMPNYNVTLFPNHENDLEQIKRLRSDNLKLTETNNQLARRVWDINAKLHSVGLNPSKKIALEEEKEALILAAAHYPPKIQEVRNTIEQLERSVYGVSHINSDSPTETDEGLGL